VQSKITGGATVKIFSGKILGKYQVDYFKCLDTGFIQTEEPYWLKEAYSSAITKLDIGLASRNEHLRNVVAGIISRHFNINAMYLDYAGGYGLFTRLMRDNGFDYYHFDPYCKNIFSEYFELADSGKDSNFELVTASEVFEHLPDPVPAIREMLRFSDNLFFTTELQPEKLTTIDDWTYFIPETGQHVSFYTEKSLAYIAHQFGRHFYTNGVNLHMFTAKELEKNPFEKEQIPFLIRTMKRKVERFFRAKNSSKESLLQRDWEMIREKLTS